MFSLILLVIFFLYSPPLLLLLPLLLLFSHSSLNCKLLYAKVIIWRIPLCGKLLLSRFVDLILLQKIWNVFGIRFFRFYSWLNHYDVLQSTRNAVGTRIENTLKWYVDSKSKKWAHTRYAYHVLACVWVWICDFQGHGMNCHTEIHRMKQMLFTCVVTDKQSKLKRAQRNIYVFQFFISILVFFFIIWEIFFVFSRSFFFLIILTATKYV